MSWLTFKKTLVKSEGNLSFQFAFCAEKSTERNLRLFTVAFGCQIVMICHVFDSWHWISWKFLFRLLLANDCWKCQSRMHKPYLNPRLRKVDFQRDFLAHKNVRISRLVKQRLEEVELGARVGRAFPSLFSAVSCEEEDFSHSTISNWSETNGKSSPWRHPCHVCRAN